MLELLESLLMAIIMVPLVMAIMLGLIYGLGELFNLISGTRGKDDQTSGQSTHP
ncbi:MULTISPECIES: AcrZ family multidrug efflux pump-associated protein [Tatumella]|uniref:Multidrug efflux pump accessory protein AcrZ n=1 Tax=Tatumella punctata TaxID=399969 RepID=A0ABW1VNR5_9GAMM|nr:MULTISPECIES: AcrZ family multidrug efflux pump-associated protein [unclassified Tatumella]MBS0854643.1 AcrZ family multidrug efflux pump-associated protein [Tatumella sp. JGM16]MBS0875912.1 AcrZ family multidrug efflux pump-associated protein [Tatumella sp. JGM82]MBS0890317.1 AcrZ family multidrug efflux pump-associated protein [Tatumella sp. JGM94]MBS0892576.1 AcrZ family multidrug efflux pump-associated protein [Tatumella sp. JGM130]MBS0900443.1 AcrZ family multidrug efflux pump-associat